MKLVRCLPLICGWLLGSGMQAAASTQALQVSDAEAFATLFTQSGGAPLASQLQNQYLTNGSAGVRIFTPNRIVSAERLAQQVAKNRPLYQRAVAECLPQVRNMSARSTEIMHQVASLLGEQQPAPAYVVFGANNSGGTASAEGLVLGIEVLCALSADLPAFTLLFEDFIAHEIVHVYQNRLLALRGQPTLLEQALIEGTADFVAELVLGRVSSAASDRTQYGLAHEAALWQQFQAQMHDHKTADWMYQQKTAAGIPADLGYWVGKQIVAAYYQQATDKAAALRQLLQFSAGADILRQSGYDTRFTATAVP